MKLWHVNSSVKILSLSPSHVRKLSGFFYLWIAVYFHISTDESEPKAKENFPVVLMWASLQLFFEWLKNSAPCSISSTSACSLTKMSRNKAKIYQETDLYSWFVLMILPNLFVLSPFCFVVLKKFKNWLFQLGSWHAVVIGSVISIQSTQV